MSGQARDVQTRIFIKGLSGKKPELPLRYEELKEAARQKISPEAFAYVAGSAGEESTKIRNNSGFEKYRILPRMLQGHDSVDTSVKLFGKKLPNPFLIAPIGALKMVHPEADLAVAKACAKEDVPMIFSSQGSVPMEDCAKVMGDKDRWFQLYYSQSDELARSMVERAEQSGCTAIVVTLDTTRLGWRPRDLKLAYLPFLRGIGIAQYTSDPVFQKMLDQGKGEALEGAPKPSVSLQTLKALWQQKANYPAPWSKKLFSDRPMRAVRLFINTYSRPDLNWSDLERIKEWTKLPIILKGIVHPEDAALAKSKGFDGLILSNHGGRQVDGGISTIEMLPAVAEKVGKDFPLLFDSGIRTGAHAMKALALGAHAVCIGRPFVYALAHSGEKGIRKLLQYYKASLELNMSLAGCRDIEDLSPEIFSYH